LNSNAAKDESLRNFVFYWKWLREPAKASAMLLTKVLWGAF
jgi:hypothetical protein